jgi:alkylation response protein AidB-like acyl-CoA dehydrogenase
MRFLQPSRSVDVEQGFDRAYPILAALRRTNARQVNECEETWLLFDSFSSGVVDRVALELDQTGFDNPEQPLASILLEACRCKIFSLSLPRSVGGQGVSLLALSVGLERLSRSCLGIANLLAVHGLALGVLGAVGALSQLRQIAAQVIEGERRGQPYLISTAATEPNAGTDFEDIDLLRHAQLRCEANRVPGGWKINGPKVFVSNGSLASAYVVLAPTDCSQPVNSLSAFLVERDRPGVNVVRVEHKLGQRACPAAELNFVECFVPESHKLNQQTVAGKALDLVLGATRSSVAAFGSGAAWGALEDCQRIFSTGALQPPNGSDEGASSAILSQMWQNARLARSSYLEAVLANACFGLTSLVEVAILRQLDRVVPVGISAWATSLRFFESPMLNREARRWLDHLKPEQVAAASAHASAAKIACSRLALHNCELAQELLGPIATLESTGIPKRWRDARLLSIYEGTNELNALDVYKKGVLLGKENSIG